MTLPQNDNNDMHDESVIKIGVTYRSGGPNDQINENNLRYIRELSNSGTLKNTQVEALSIDWRYSVNNKEIDEFLQTYQKELDNSPHTNEQKEQLIVEAKESYQVMLNQNLDAAINDYINRVDAIYIPGMGYDPSPEFCEDYPNYTEADKRREVFERKLVKIALEKGIPVLGICAGAWLVASCFEGAKTNVIQDPNILALHNYSNEAEVTTVKGQKINKVRLDAHSLQVKSGSMLEGIAKNASNWTPQSDETNIRLKKNLQLQKKISNEIKLTLHSDLQENNLTVGYHLSFDKSKQKWQLTYVKQNTIDILENLPAKKLVSTSIAIELIEGLEKALSGKSFMEVGNDIEMIRSIITNSVLFWVNSIHWRVIVPQDEKTGKIDTTNQLVISAIDPIYRTIEAFETKFGVPIIGIQWHPELTIPEWITKNGCIPNPDYPVNRRILEAFAESADAYAKKKNVTHEIKSKVDKIRADGSTLFRNHPLRKSAQSNNNIEINKKIKKG